MAKKKNTKEIEYEEIDGYKYEIKNPSRKGTVLAFQNMVKNSHADYVSRNRMMEKKKVYAEGLLKNISRAPFTLGWLCWPEDEAQIRVINMLEPIVEKPSKRKKSNKKVSKKPASPKKPLSPKKPASPKKPSIKSIKKS